MHITSYVELTEAQKATLRSFETVVVRTSPIEPTVVATFTTFQLQFVKATIDASGVIQAVSISETE